MDTSTLYICHPPDGRSNAAALVEAFVSGPVGKALLSGWKVVTVCCRHDCHFSARDLHARVQARPGPVLLLRPVQQVAVGELRARLQDRQIVDVVEIVDEAGLEVALRNLIGQHNAGEPVLPIDLVVALLLMRKLDKEHRWTGNAKGYMWADDLPNGKGVDIQYKPRLGLVIKVLTEAEYLTFKISNGSKKYALNPVHREAMNRSWFAR